MCGEFGSWLLIFTVKDLNTTHLFPVKWIRPILYHDSLCLQPMATKGWPFPSKGKMNKFCQRETPSESMETFAESPEMYAFSWKELGVATEGKGNSSGLHPWLPWPLVQQCRCQSCLPLWRVSHGKSIVKLSKISLGGWQQRMTILSGLEQYSYHFLWLLMPS